MMSAKTYFFVSSKKFIRKVHSIKKDSIKIYKIDTTFMNSKNSKT